VSETASRVPAVDGWFTTGDEPHLIGAHCPQCGTYVFPPRSGDCPNPGCDAAELQPTPLSRRGTLWSYAENRYPPPPPFVAGEVFEPYALAAVELEAEGMIVLGQVAKGILAADLRVGMPMVLELGELLPEPGEDPKLIYVWAPA
jgi:uncharacterized OB-fold protein